MSTKPSQQSSGSYDILIVGCGPTGATFANYFRKFGHTVAIFDRDTDVFPAPRGTGLDDESMRVYQALGLVARLQDEEHIREFDLWFKDNSSRQLMAFDRYNLGEDLLFGENGYHKQVAFHQPSLERVLRDDFAQPGGAHPYLGCEVLSVQDCGSYCELVAKNVDSGEEQKFRGQYIIGCDGGKSMVRREMNVGRIDLNYTEDYMILDAHVEDDIYLRTRVPDGAIINLDPKHAGVLKKSAHGHVRFDFLQHKDVVGENLVTDQSFREAGEKLIRARGLDPEKFTIERCAPYRFYAGTAAQWRQGRLFLAGDAAHQTPPWSGQGLNMCMRDASNLSFKMHLVLSGKASDSLLDTYFDERQPPSIHTIKGAVDMGKLMQTQSRLKLGLRDFAFFVTRNSRFIRRRAQKIWQRKPPYTQGLIGKRHKLAGTIMPQPKLASMKGEMHMLDDMIGLRFALVTACSPTGPDVERFVREQDGAILKLGTDFQDPTGKLLGWFMKNKVTAVLMRPDRYIYDAGNDVNVLCSSLLDAL